MVLQPSPPIWLKRQMVRSSSYSTALSSLITKLQMPREFWYSWVVLTVTSWLLVPAGMSLEHSSLPSPLYFRRLYLLLDKLQLAALFPVALLCWGHQEWVATGRAGHPANGDNDWLWKRTHGSLWCYFRPSCGCGLWFSLEGLHLQKTGRWRAHGAIQYWYWVSQACQIYLGPGICSSWACGANLRVFHPGESGCWCVSLEKKSWGRDKVISQVFE